MGLVGDKCGVRLFQLDLPTCLLYSTFILNTQMLFMLVLPNVNLLLYSVYAKRGDPHSNWLCTFIQFRNVAASTWLRLSLHYRLSTYCSEVAQATPPNVSLA